MVYYKPTPKHLEQMAEHKNFKEKDGAILKKDWREDLELSAKPKVY